MMERKEVMADAFFGLFIQVPYVLPIAVADEHLDIGQCGALDLLVWVVFKYMRG